MSWQYLIDFWIGMGWIANMLTVVIGVPTVLTILWKVFKWLVKSYSIKKYNRVADYVSTIVPNEQIVLRTLKQNIRIAIVDDNLDDFPTTYLRKTGWSIDQISSISLSEVKRLSQYSLIFLDIAGVVPEDMKRGGLSLLTKLKRLQKPPAIIAVSGKKFDPTVTEFFQAADDVMKKPMTEEECEDQLERTAIENFSPLRASKRLDDLTTKSGIDPTKQESITHSFISYLEGSYSDSKLKSYLEKIGLRDWVNVAAELEIILHWTTKRESN